MINITNLQIFGIEEGARTQTKGIENLSSEVTAETF
jgi:hypothetical protein